MNINGVSTYNFLQNYTQSSGAAGRNSSASSAAGVEFSLDISVEEVEPAAPTVEDVKKEFADFLSSLQITQRGTSISVSVSDSAWEKMAADPEYKQKMMDLCKRDLCDPAWGTTVPAPALTTIRIDADAEEEYLASGYGSAVADKADTSDSWWTRRSERHKTALEEAQELALGRREMMDFLQQRVDQRKQLAGGSHGVGSANAITSCYSPSTTSATAGLLGAGSYV
ncbi:MAG: hypothetical protein LUC93_18325 [Planctomycetaceae bacterium]|nr:hypothetical protein [Planctomycetaceae bacterium]